MNARCALSSLLLRALCGVLLMPTSACSLMADTGEHTFADDAAAGSDSGGRNGSEAAGGSDEPDSAMPGDGGPSDSSLPDGGEADDAGSDASMATCDDADCMDDCPNDPEKTTPGLCGCGVPEPPSGQASDCVDGCPDDPAKKAPGLCGCGQPETDSDGDRTPDCADECPDNSMLTEAGTCGCTTLAPRGSYCGGDLPMLDSIPAIDGEVECGLPLETLTPLGWNGPDGAPLPDGNSARYAIAWHPDGIYFFVEVQDPDRAPNAGGLPHCGDSVEVYVDHTGDLGDFYSRPGTAQVVIQAPSTDDVPERRAGLFAFTSTGPVRSEWLQVQYFGAFPRPTGYVVEALVTKAALDLSELTFTTGADVGVSVSINVSDSTGLHTDQLINCEDGKPSKRLGQYFLRLAPSNNVLCGTGEPWCTEKAFCVDRLN